MLPGPLQNSLPGSLGAAFCLLVPLMLISVDVCKRENRSSQLSIPLVALSPLHILFPLSSALKRLDLSSVAAAASSSLQGPMCPSEKGHRGCSIHKPLEAARAQPRAWEQALGAVCCPKRGLCLLLPSAL